MLNSKSFLGDSGIDRTIYSTKYDSAIEGNEFLIHADDMNKPQKLCAEQNKPDIKEHIWHMSVDLKF